MSDIDMDDSKEGMLYKIIKNKLKEILLYLESNQYALSSSSFSNKINIEHLTIYNILRKQFNKKYGIPSKARRLKFNHLYFNVIAELFDCNDYISKHKEFVKLVSLFN